MREILTNDFRMKVDKREKMNIRRVWNPIKQLVKIWMERFITSSIQIRRAKVVKENPL